MSRAHHRDRIYVRRCSLGISSRSTREQTSWRTISGLCQILRASSSNPADLIPATRLVQPLDLIHLRRPYIESPPRSVTHRTSSGSTVTLCTRVRGCLAGPGSSTSSLSSGFSSHSRILSAQSTTASFRSFLGHANPWTRIHASSRSEFVASRSVRDAKVIFFAISRYLALL